MDMKSGYTESETRVNTHWGITDHGAKITANAGHVKGSDSPTRKVKRQTEETVNFVDVNYVRFYIGFILDGFTEYEDLRNSSQRNLREKSEIFLAYTPTITTSQMRFEFVKDQPIIIEVRLSTSDRM